MKTTVIQLEGIESVLSPTGVEKNMCSHTGIHKVENNFMTCTATVYQDDALPWRRSNVVWLIVAMPARVNSCQTTLSSLAIRQKRWLSQWITPRTQFTPVTL